MITKIIIYLFDETAEEKNISSNRLFIYYYVFILLIINVDKKGMKFLL
jgi:hypothetical protein